MTGGESEDEVENRNGSEGRTKLRLKGSEERDKEGEDSDILHTIVLRGVA